MDQTPEQVLSKSLVAENKLNKLIDEVKEQNHLDANQIIIGGFSQGCMITIQTGIKRKDKVNSIIGYSGRIIDTNHLSKNINSRPNIILMHGDKDQVVPVDSLLESKDFFGKNNYEIEIQIFKNCEHRIPTEGSSLGLQFIKKHFNL
jgi:phospholipase/carboxylesterase